MELYLHIGTNKTASSYLQSLQTQNKTLLGKAGVYVPDSEWDPAMQRGVITPGNGHELAKILCVSKNRKKNLTAYLEKISTLGKQKRCNKIALSNEVLIRLFSSEDLLSDLSRTAENTGFEKIRLFCVLRNPYEHALSLYKHRMKSMAIVEYDAWLQTDYKTMFLFDLFLSHSTDFKGLNWLFKVYRKDATYMSKIYFNEFLGIETAIPDTLTKSVNPSMSLRGIKTMEIMDNTLRGSGKNFYRYCMETGIKIAESTFLEHEFFRAYETYLNSCYPDIISRIAELLPPNDRMEFKINPKEPEMQNSDKILTWDGKELQLVNEVLLETKRRKTQTSMELIMRKWKQKILGKKNNFDSARYGGSLRT